MREPFLQFWPIVSPRRATMLLEVTIAAALLGVLMTISVRMLHVMGDRQRAAECRAAALQTVQALAEQLTNLPWEELTAQAAELVEIPEAMKPKLPGGKIKVTVVEDTDPMIAKRVTLELQWTDPRGQPAAPVQLTIWAYPESELHP